MTLRFHTQLWLAAFGAAGAAVAVATTLVSLSVRAHVRGQIERTLVGDARLAAELLSRRGGAPPGGVDAEADAIAERLGVRVTLIAADGRVVGDSAQDDAGLAALDNHGRRPEVVAAKATGLGVVERYSTTVGANLLYVAVPTRSPEVAVVRVALPLTDVQKQLGAVRRAGGVALAVALLVAFVAAGAGSALVARRVSAIARAAAQYAAGDASVALDAGGADELATVARALDTTARQLRERMAELARDRARLETILSGVAEGVLLIDAHSRVELANDAARRMLRSDDPVAGRHIVEVIRHPQVAAIVEAALAGRSTTGEALALPHAPDRWYQVRGAPISGAGHGALVVWHDVTDLKRTDQIRRDFVANVSHELRTPLTAIRGAVEALQEADGEGSAPQARFLGMIARHACRMERLVQDLLRLARLDAGQEPLELAPCALASVVAGVEAELQPLIARKRQRLAVTLAPDAETVTADAAKLHDILRNLVENAAAYAPDGTTIAVAARRDATRVVLTVADEGPGIPEPDLARVFERFYRVDRARTREAGGTGLGLSIVKHLVELHGGTVEAANRPEGGAVFSVRLPN